ncbi:MAG: hypothetical protein ATN35_03325 [Epulopiscium sp. Nele67-Bin004]|nr:MAG: hypothetical protein ATN35_03325 [Epulopiscium sp. Nele67-Bin004]
MKDKQLVGRLLGYAKPYTLQFVLIITMMLISTTSELSKPIIIGNTVDLFVEGYKTPLAQVSGDAGQVEFEGNRYVRTYNNISEYKFFSYIVNFNDNYYFLENISSANMQKILDTNINDLNNMFKIENEMLVGDVYGEIYVGRVLSGDELKVLRAQDFDPLVKQGMLYVLAIAVSFTFVYMQTLLLRKVGQKIIKQIRIDVYEKMLSLPSRYYHKNQVGGLVTKVTNDTESLNEMYTSVIVSLFQYGLYLLGIIVVMLNINPKITMYVFMVLPIVIVATVIFKHYSRLAYRETRNYLTEMNIFLSEHLMGMKLIQIFTREEKTFDRMKNINDNLFKAGCKEIYAFMVYRPTLFSVANLSVALVLLIGSKEVLAGTLTIGVVVIMMSYVKEFYNPIEQMAEVFNILQSALSAAEKIFAVLDEENEIVSGDAEIDDDTFKGEIEFKNVWFAYNDEEWILKNVSFKIEAGQKVAFVGATGAGKTSILGLIARYYDIQKGQILIDGKDIKSYKISSLRRQMGEVLQDVFMFTGNIADNIRLGRVDITDAQVEVAAKTVYANSFIEKLKNKYQEEVIEGGATLSTGERQLLSFARAVAYDPKIFMLDEATSNIDTETEGIIQEALYKMMENRTTIMVAHRLATIQHSDNIIVLHKGELMESGTHQDLLGKKGLYHQLYELSLNQA